jgi:PAS domain S-box-containing protein
MYGDVDADFKPETKSVESKYLDIEREIREIERGLSEPNRALNLIYAISHLIEDQDFSLADTLSEILDLITNAWQYPEITCARITLDVGEEFKTSNYKQTPWKQTCDIIAYGGKIGSLELAYLEEMPQIDEGPFLTEERNLISFLSRLLGLIINHKQEEKILDIYRNHVEGFGQEKQTLQELEESLIGDLLDRDRYEIAFTSSGMGLWDWNLETDEIYFSPGWKSMLGYLGSELENRPEEWFGRLHPEDTESVRSSLEAHLEGLTQIYEEEFRMLHDDGTYRWVLCRGIVLRDTKYNPYRVSGIIIDITERRRIEDELREARSRLAEQNQRMRVVLDSMSDAVAMFDLEGNILLCNKDYRELFGLTVEELKSMSPNERWKYALSCFQESEQFEELVGNFYLSSQDDLKHIVKMREPRQSILYHYMRFIKDEGQNPVAFISVYRDISHEIEIDKMRAEISHLRFQLEKQNSFNNIIGESREMQRVYDLIRHAGESDITVLIRGDSGTGKELVARAIHFASMRKEGPLIAINCAAIPDTLIESELFGHERGAFTGASSRRVGKFEQADGGAIILDEIGAMSSSNQAALLRVLQDGEIQRVGGTKSIPVDVRVIAITNKDLEAAMKAGVFREDLYYRISAFPIILPLLKERSEDIPLLAEHFLNHYAKDAGKEISFFSDEAMQCLMRYHWPGNVRELGNAVNRAVLLETSNVLRAKSLPKYIQSASGGTGPNALTFGDVKADELPTFEEVEKRLLKHALKVTRGNISQVARALGIGRVTVYRKLERYKLLKED